MNAVSKDPMVPTPMQIMDIRREIDQTVTLTREPGNGASGGFKPGQFEMLYVFGVGEVPISISGDPSDPTRVEYTIRSVGGVTNHLCGLEPGQMVGVRGPYGNGWPMDVARGRDVLIVAGGIGLAPLRPVVHELLRHREEFGSIDLLYGTRSPDTVLYSRQIDEWEKNEAINVRLTVDRSDAGWRHNVGVVTDLIPGVRLDPDRTVAMVCGPEIMMRFTAMALHRQGLSDRQIYLSLERNMHCGIGLCGRCQLGPLFVCKDGPVFLYESIKRWFETREL